MESSSLEESEEENIEEDEGGMVDEASMVDGEEESGWLYEGWIGLWKRVDCGGYMKGG